MIDYLKSFNLFTDYEIDDFLKLTETKHVKKGDTYMDQNEVSNSLSFIKSGIFW